MSALWQRSLLAWVVLLGLAIVNGTFRERVLLPRVGEPQAHQLSTLLLAALILAATWMMPRWLAAPDPRAAWRIGAHWVALLPAFELLAGRFLLHRPWEALAAEYDLARGRPWVLIPLVTLAAPRLWIGHR
jgi:hypothetical protein